MYTVAADVSVMVMFHHSYVYLLMCAMLYLGICTYMYTIMHTYAINLTHAVY